MPETKFTPGPWYLWGMRQSPKPRVFMYQVRGANHDVLFTTAQYGVHSGAPLDPEVRTANANLISAAPEMLAALELCLKNSEFRRASGVESGPMIEREIEAARAAINKAKGV